MIALQEKNVTQVVLAMHEGVPAGTLGEISFFLIGCVAMRLQTNSEFLHTNGYIMAFSLALGSCMDSGIKVYICQRSNFRASILEGNTSDPRIT